MRIVPVWAAAGTATMSVSTPAKIAAFTEVAATKVLLPKATLSSVAVTEKPMPMMVAPALAGPSSGVNLVMASCVAAVGERADKDLL